MADTKFPVAFSGASNPGENVSLRKNTFCSRLTSDKLNFTKYSAAYAVVMATQH